MAINLKKSNNLSTEEQLEIILDKGFNGCMPLSQANLKIGHPRYNHWSQVNNVPKYVMVGDLIKSKEGKIVVRTECRRVFLYSNLSDSDQELISGYIFGKKYFSTSSRQVYNRR